MKRSRLKRSTKPLKRKPLNRGASFLKRKPIKRKGRLKPRSDKMKDLYAGPNGRRMFVSVFLADNPYCAVKWDGCQVGSRHVHEVFARGIGGAIVPGEKANRQWQVFVPICAECHRQLTLQPPRAKHEGWVRSHQPIIDITQGR